MGAEGFEQPPLLAEKSGSACEGGAKGGALASKTGLPEGSDPDLRALVAAWPNLSADARAAIMLLAGLGGAS